MNERRRLIIPLKNSTIKSILVTLLLLIILPAGESIFVSGETNPQDVSNPNDTFSIMQITDTQYLAASYPQLFTNLTSWIVNNSEYYNTQMVIHTGDIVDEDSKTYQWENANNSMSILLNSKIPYCWCAGNHDQAEHWSSASWNGSHYLAFNSYNMKNKAYWLDDIFSSKNTAVQFAFGLYKFLIINLEYHANSSAIDWMKNILANNMQDSNVIIATHSYLNDTQGYGYGGDYLWEQNFKTLLSNYPNVFLTLSGHDNIGQGANMSRVGNREEIFFNRQGMDNLTSAASARIYTFNLTSMQISVKTYLIYSQTFLTDPYNSYAFNINLQQLILPTNSPTTVTYSPQNPFSTPFPIDVPTPNVTNAPTPSSLASTRAISTPIPDSSYVPTETPTSKPILQGVIYAVIVAAIIALTATSTIVLRKRFIKEKRARITGH